MRAALARVLPPTLLALAILAALAPTGVAADLNVTLPVVTGTPGQLVDVPITVSPGPAGFGILSIDFRLTLDPTVAFTSDSKPDGFLQTWGTAFWNGTSTYLAAAAAGATPVTSTSTLLNTVQVRLRPNAVVGTIMPLAFQHILFNEGTPTVAVTNGSLQVVAPAASALPPAPDGFALALASPNPARDAAVFACSAPGGARLAIFGVDGRRVRVFGLDGAGFAASVRWDLRDARGVRVPPGVYLAALTGAGAQRTCRVLVLD